ncbi:hypothetical protein NPIL_675391, partial [Nephila pilipes]
TVEDEEIAVINYLFPEVVSDMMSLDLKVSANRDDHLETQNDSGLWNITGLRCYNSSC